MILLATQFYAAEGQSIVDPCFSSIDQPGFIFGTPDLANTCLCTHNYLAADLLQWDGTEWLGDLIGSDITIVPPRECNTRAIWMSQWTSRGEGFAMRLDRPFQPGKTYSYTFTYASDGVGSKGNFAPKVYTNSVGSVRDAKFLGRLTAASGWRTDTFTFTAENDQSDHTWLILYIDDDAGMVLSNCVSQELIVTSDTLMVRDTAICEGTTIQFDLPAGDFTYVWNTGETTRSITASEPGYYVGIVDYLGCKMKDSVRLELVDCEVRLSIPNFFSPNSDDKNPVFTVYDFNQIESGKMQIFNRWGDLIFEGDIFTGWDGTSNGKENSSGTYFYLIMYLDAFGEFHESKGSFTLAR